MDEALGESLLLTKTSARTRELCFLSRFAGKKVSRRADSNRLPLLHLRVISLALQGFALACNSRIDKLVSLLRLALGCIVLRSRWCQEYVNIGVNCSFPRYAQGGIRVSLTQHCLVASIVHDQLVAGH